MKIDISQSAIRFLESKNKNVVTLFIRATGGGWCGVVYIPDIDFKVPEALEHYHHETVEGIQLYASKESAVNATNIKFQLRGVWIFKRITVTGIQFPKI